ncbi:MAG: hypothetical protein KZQ95_20070 [Candidatus Thiodiazotropha sp. (ex Epidulcina cf. delphinae)]|nr:hypothetical protein [Candidatus Thiodiazotropha sp. (ex Epidulcina cf. delphinae)]
MEKDKRHMAMQNRLHHCLFWLLLFSFALFSVGCSDSQAKKSKKKNFVQQGDYIRFELGGEKFKIQKGYFKGSGNTPWGTLTNMKFWALLPDFKVYDKLTNHSDFFDVKGWGSKLQFQLRLKRIPHVSVPKIVEANKKAGGGMQFSGRLGSPDEMKYDLEAYYATKYAPDDYLYRPNGESRIYISCRSKVMKVPYPGCDMLWDYSDAIYLEASFNRKYLPQWQTILEKIQKLIKG